MSEARRYGRFCSAPRIAYDRVNGKGSFWGLGGSASLKNRTLTLTVVNPHASAPRETEIAVRGGSGNRRSRDDDGGRRHPCPQHVRESGCGPASRGPSPRRAWRDADVSIPAGVGHALSRSNWRSKRVPSPTSHVPRPRPTSHVPRPTSHVPRPTSHVPRPTSRDKGRGTRD